MLLVGDKGVMFESAPRSDGWRSALMLVKQRCSYQSKSVTLWIPAGSRFDEADVCAQRMFVSI